MRSRAIYGCAGTALSAAERDFFRETRPWGFILFARNISEPAQVKLLVDQTSIDLLGGAEIDFVEDLVGSSFQVRNPNASSSCGCGSSFSI